MRKTIIDIKEISDSKEVYGERPNPFISIFIYTIVALLIVAIAYSCIGKIEIVATASGIIRPNKDISTVMSLVDGKVRKSKYKDGQVVKKGDTLISIDVSNEQIQLDGLKTKLSDYSKDSIMYSKFVKGLRKGKNPFSSNKSSIEYPYYIQYRNYVLSKKNTQKETNYQKSQTNKKIKNLKVQIENLNTEILGLEAYKESIKQQKNLVSAYPEYETKYQLYMSDLDQLYNNYVAEKRAVKSADAYGTSNPDYRGQLSDIESSYKTAKEQKRLQTLADVNTELKAARAELRSCESDLKLYTIDHNYYFNSDNGNSAKTGELASILTEQKTAELQVKDLSSQIKLAENQIRDSAIKAGQSGVISVNTKLISGDKLTAGTVLATIIPLDDSEYRVYIYVNNSDIADIEVGDKVRYNLAALPSSQYGVVEGKVEKIASDALVQDGEYSGYYLVEGSISKQQLQDKDGNVGEITVGMQLEAKIVTEKKTIMRYFLEKINLFW